MINHNIEFAIAASDTDVQFEFVGNELILTGGETQIEDFIGQIEQELQQQDPTISMVLGDRQSLGTFEVGEWVCDTGFSGNLVIDRYKVQGESFFVIDNDDSRVTMNTPWRESTAILGYHGSDYLTTWSDDPNQDGPMSIIYRPNVSNPGVYRISINWTANPNRATNVPIEIHHANGVETIHANQETNGGRWMPLGTFELDTNGDYYVRMSNEGVDEYVIADAIRFERDWTLEAMEIAKRLAQQRNFANTFTNANYRTTSDGWRFRRIASGISNIEAEAEQFWTQWGLSTDSGIGLSSGDMRFPKIAYSGSGIKVGIFDTSPYMENGRESFNMAPLSMELDAFSYEISPTIFITKASKHHGLVVSSLFHAVAPEAEIQLHRIMNHYGEGDIFALNQALNTFIDNTSGPAVINLSLGILAPLDGNIGLSCNDDVASLKTILYKAYKKGIVIVAGAGNGSNDYAQIPAIWDFVIDVSATESGYGLATYSNHGSVAAPGGSKADCRVNPEQCMVGAATAFDTGYAYWTGTSFAAPLVSGLAALFLEHDPTLTPDQVTQRIYQSTVPGTQGAGRGAGVIDLNCGSLAGDLLRENCICGTGVDNSDGSGFQLVGNDWIVSSVVDEFIETNYVHDNNNSGNKGVSRAIFTPAIPESGGYQVFINWTSHPNRATNVPIEIKHANGTDTVVVDQKQNGGMWYPLGTYFFSADGSETITVDTTGTDGFVIADAVKFIPQDGCPVTNETPHDIFFPKDMQSTTGSQIHVPVSVADNLTGWSYLSYEFTASYNPAVLKFDRAETEGTMSDGLPVVALADGAGQVNVAAYGSVPFEGRGALVTLVFDVIGGEESESDLVFSHFMFNESDPDETTHNGHFEVPSSRTPGNPDDPSPIPSISGNIRYYSNQQPIHDMTVTLEGGSEIVVQTDSSGFYTTTIPSNSSYKATPSRQTVEGGFLTSYDASRILQCITNHRPLTDCPTAVADVSGDGTVTPYDAALIALYILGDTNIPSLTGQWRFSPESRTYPTVDRSYTSQDYIGYLMGDVTGNWPNEDTDQGRSVNATDVFVEIPVVEPTEAQHVTIPISVTNITGLDVTAFGMTVLYDTDLLVLTALSREGGLSDKSDWIVVHNDNDAGRLPILGYGVLPLEGEGVLLQLTFQVVGEIDNTTSLMIEEPLLNEGNPSISLLLPNSVYMPYVPK